MTDLDEAIRADVGARRKNAQRDGISADEEQDPRLAKVADDAEALADAVLCALDVATAIHPGDGVGLTDFDRACRVSAKSVRVAIAKALGIAVGE